MRGCGVNCETCGTTCSPTDAFCRQCGQQLKFAVNNVGGTDAAAKETPRPSKKTPGVRFIAMTIGAVLVGLSLFAARFGSEEVVSPEASPTSSSKTPMPSETYSPPSNIAIAIGMEITEVLISDGTCSEATTAIGIDGAFGRAEERIELMSQVKNSYEAFDFLANRENSFVTYAAQLDPEARLGSLSAGYLSELVANSGWRWSASFKSQSPDAFDKFTQSVQTRILTECNLFDAYGLAIDFHSLAKSLEARAASRPWYPEGFTVYLGNSDVAYSWAERGCTYSSGRCAHMDIVTKSGADNLYVEVTFSDSNGAYVDWSNDTARALRAGQIAKLEFVTFDNSARNVKIAEITTY